MTAAPVQAIFVRGITQRSGTNYLRDLALTHPHCRKARVPIFEDFALDHAGLLESYAKAVAAQWPESWKVDVERTIAEMLAGIGTGVMPALLGAGPGETVVAKTPTVNGLDHFWHLFPDQALVVLIRDGRDVVESLSRSFGHSFERGARQWVRGADQVIAFRDRHADSLGTKWLLLRYEEVLADPGGALRSICAIAGLDDGLINRSDASALPVRGSSTFGKSGDTVDWTPVAVDESFQPTGRWRTWSRARLARFEHVAGAQMAALGYGGDAHHGGRDSDDRLRGAAQSVRHLVLDVVGAGEDLARRRRRDVGRWVRAHSREVRS